MAEDPAEVGRESMRVLEVEKSVEDPDAAEVVDSARRIQGATAMGGCAARKLMLGCEKVRVSRRKRRSARSVSSTYR